MNIKLEAERHRQNYKLIVIIAGVVAGLGIFYSLLKIIWGFDALAFLDDLYHVKYRPPLVAGVGLGIVLLYGFLTSFHCIGMCGGIIVSQTVGNPAQENEETGKKTWWGPSLTYNLGRLTMNVAIGGLVGGIGQMFSFSGPWKGLVPIISGIIMLIMGIDILIGLSFVKRIRSHMRMHMPKIFTEKLFGQTAGGPFYVGLLTGLLPCGPLQIAQVYALGTGSVLGGAVSMFVFSIGTIPVLFTFGALSTIINKKFTAILLKVSAVLVIVLGLLMLSKGLTLGEIINSNTSPAGNMVQQSQTSCCN